MQMLTHIKHKYMKRLSTQYMSTSINQHKQYKQHMTNMPETTNECNNVSFIFDHGLVEKQNPLYSSDINESVSNTISEKEQNIENS